MGGLTAHLCVRMTPDHSGKAAEDDSSYGPSWLPPGTGRSRRRLIRILALLIVTGLAAGVSIAAVSLQAEQRPPGAVLAGQRPSEEVVAPPTPEAVDTATPPQPTETGPPASSIWRPDSDEVYPNAKRLAAKVAQQLTTYDAATTPEAAAAAVTKRFDVKPGRVLDAARELVVRDAQSSSTVVYPQLGGMTATAASVMVVVDQALAREDLVELERRTVDVRLRLDGDRWRLDSVNSGGGTAAPRPSTLSASAVTVLGHDSISLTDSARWDIYRGRIDDRLLRLLASAADRHDIAVTTLASGHPRNVFATDLISNHTRGRAVDIFAVDGQEVVEQRAKGSRAFKLTRWLFNQGIPELGSPWALDGPGGRSFTDVVHADHIHAAV